VDVSFPTEWHRWWATPDLDHLDTLSFLTPATVDENEGIRQSPKEVPAQSWISLDPEWLSFISQSLGPTVVHSGSLPARFLGGEATEPQFYPHSTSEEYRLQSFDTHFAVPATELVNSAIRFPALHELTTTAPAWHHSHFLSYQQHAHDWTAPAPAIAVSSPIDPEGGGISALGFKDGAANNTGRNSSSSTNTSTPPLTEFLVQFSAGATVEQKKLAISSVGGTALETVRPADGHGGELVLIKIGSGQAVDHVITALERNPVVSFAEPNWSVSAQFTSNDTYYTGGSLWGMYGDETSPKNAFGSQAGEAWATGQIGSRSVVVGVIDTGIDYTHQDLYLNVWLNQGEIPILWPDGKRLVDVDKDGLITFWDLNRTENASFVSDLNGNGRIDAGDLLKDARWVNGTDQDGNGYVDDLIGWDFVNNDNDPFDDNGHGTHVSGTIGALGGNGTGVIGVSPNVQIMALKFLSGSGSGSTSGAIKAVDYYSNAAAAASTSEFSDFIATNNSWGGGGYSQALLDSIIRGARQDVLFIAAAGNGGPDRVGDNNDSIANYPSNYSTLQAVGFDAVVAVAALTSSGSLASYSNYGQSTVDLAAPGSGIWSTVPGGGYASYNGTSMATPHVTGALALYAAADAELNLTAAQLRDVLLSSTTATSSLSGKTVTGGRLDVSKMFASSAPTDGGTGITVYGTTASESITGTAYSDVLAGVPATGTNLGRGTVDKLTGLTGNDLFILGDSRGRFYDDGNSKNAGTGDYGLITDFTSGDKIQLAKGNYFLSSTTLNGVSGTGIYHDSNNSGRFDKADELIGLVQNIAPSSLSSADFWWA
jgi:subtilisin family serine protease